MNSAVIKQLLAYVNENSVRPMMPATLAHILYLADWRHLLDHGTVRTGIKWSFTGGRLDRSDYQRALEKSGLDYRYAASYRHPLSANSLPVRDKAIIDKVLTLGLARGHGAYSFSEEAIIRLALSTYPAMVDANSLEAVIDAYRDMQKPNALKR